MQQNDVNVGDVVAWAKVPTGALVRDTADDYIVRGGAQVECVCSERLDRGWGYWDLALPEVARPYSDDDGPFTVIAVGLTGQETAAELQRLAEVFEVWSALEDSILLAPGADRYAIAERLHTAGFRPDGSAGAVELLSGER